MKVMGTNILFIRICVSRWHISLFYAAPALGVGGWGRIKVVSMKLSTYSIAANVCNVFDNAKYF